MGKVSAGLLLASVCLAPLAVGGVHRPVVIVLCSTALLAVVLLIVAEWQADRSIRISAAALFPAAFMLLSASQVILLPPRVANSIDPDYAALLAEGGGGSGGWRSLSLDPPATMMAFACSTAALLIFLAAYHAAAKRGGRSWVLRSIAATGGLAVAIGLGHRVFAIQKIYGVFTNGRHSAVLIGPFINGNHGAEFLELATFVGIACARLATSSLSRLGWYGIAVFCAAAAFATLSRSSVFALGVGATVLLLGSQIERLSLSLPPSPRRRNWILAAAATAAVAAVALIIGAEQLVHRFRNTAVGKDLRFGLWRDSLKVLSAHPFGIGRGAFDVVYPIYRTLEVQFPLRFSFVENEPLQMLIDFGYLGFALLLASVVFPVREFVRKRRRDGVETALLAALLAVIAHSTTDFGLETLGVLLPFVAVLGTMLGRASRPSSAQVGTPPPSPSTALSRRKTFAPAAVAVLFALVGVWKLAYAAPRNFEAELKGAQSAAEQRTLIAAARITHPVDYYYPLFLSTLEPTKPDFHGRLHALNQALRLCTACPDVHLQVARTLWFLGHHSQALAEWRTATHDRRDVFLRSLSELDRLGATQADLAKLAADNPERLLDVARLLTESSRPAQAERIIAAALQAGAPPLEGAVALAQTRMAGLDTTATREAVRQAQIMAPEDPRVVLLVVQSLLKEHGKAAAPQALAAIEQAIDRKPGDLDLQRKRIEIVASFERWSATDRAVLGLKEALQEAGRSTVEANLAAADIYLRLGRVNDALAEYRIATASEPANASLWRQFAATAETTRHYGLAREAYAEVMRLVPDDQTREALRRVDDLQAADRLGAGLGPRAVDSARAPDPDDLRSTRTLP